MDIDPDMTARASAALDTAGYAGRVTVVTADGEHGFPDRAPCDAIVVTAAAWDLPPAWAEQLTRPDGRLAVPLAMNTCTRSLGLRRAGDHWENAFRGRPTWRSLTAGSVAALAGSTRRPATRPGLGQNRVGTRA